MPLYHQLNYSRSMGPDRGQRMAYGILNDDDQRNTASSWHQRSLPVWQLIRRFTRADFLQPPPPQAFGAPASICTGTEVRRQHDDVPLTLCPGLACWVSLPFFQTDLEKRIGVIDMEIFCDFSSYTGDIYREEPHLFGSLLCKFFSYIYGLRWRF